MALTEQVVQVNVLAESPEPRVYMVQYDTGRTVRCIILDWDIPSGATARVYVRKISGKVVYNDCTVDRTSNSVLISVTNQMIAEAGADNLAMVEITSGGECVTTFAFFLVVKYKLGDGEESINESTWIDELMQKYIDEAEALLKDAGDALERADELAEEAKGLGEEAIRIATEAGEEAKQTANEAADNANAAASVANQAADAAKQTASNAAEEAVQIATDAANEAKQIANDAAEEAKQTSNDAAEKAYEAAAAASAASNGNEELFEMAMSRTSFGFLMDENNQAILADDDTGIILYYDFCNCEDVRGDLQNDISELEAEIQEIYAVLENMIATE